MSHSTHDDIRQEDVSMKNTVLANFRCFPQEYTPLDEYGFPKFWRFDYRYFYFAPFYLTIFHDYRENGCGWRVILEDATKCVKGAYLNINRCPEYSRQAAFWLPSDRAALRLLRMFEKYSTAEYLKSVCRPNNLSDVTWALEAEYYNMVKKVERFCHSYRGYLLSEFPIIPQVNKHNETLFNG